MSVDSQAEELLAAMRECRSLSPITDGSAQFDLDEGYRVADAVMRRRVAAGARVAGWKIGFTNRNIWDEYGVHAPIWGAMYEDTVRRVAKGDTIPLAALPEPRIEPEIAFRLARRPEPGMDEAALMGCIDAVTHGFEIVQSVFPGWRFQAADTVAAFAMHARFLHGDLVPVDDRNGWMALLSTFTMAMSRDGTEVDRGIAADVLGGPLSALRHMVEGMAARPLSRGLEPGDLVTTGTVTRAFPVAAGERWTTCIAGLPLAGMDVRFSG